MKYNFLRKSLMLFALLVVGAQAALAQFTATGRVTDASGQVPPIKDILVRMARPVQKGYDFQVKLERQSDNSFSTPAAFPLKGAWEAHISIEYDQGTYYDKVPLMVP